MFIDRDAETIKKAERLKNPRDIIYAQYRYLRGLNGLWRCAIKEIFGEEKIAIRYFTQ